MKFRYTGRNTSWLVLAVLVFTTGIAYADQEAFLQYLGEEAARAAGEQTTVVRGKNGWLFYAPELRSLSVGQFWGEAAAQVSRASKPDSADPLPAILDFKEQLDRAGVELLFVPVPAKTAIYPEMLNGAPLPDARIDSIHSEFYRLLEEQGVRVLDLTPIFRKHTVDEAEPLYCKQDTHWSGQACALTAQLIVDRIQDRKWLKGVAKREYQTQTRVTRITGDLWRGLADDALPKEELPLTFVRGEGGMSSVAPWRESPVLLLGDSHGLVFHTGGELHASGAGLADHLAHRLGFPVDLVAVKGSGATPSRMSLMRRRDNLQGKKLVIWCLSVREFTEGQGWLRVPVVR